MNPPHVHTQTTPPVLCPLTHAHTYAHAGGRTHIFSLWYKSGTLPSWAQCRQLSIQHRGKGWKSAKWRREGSPEPSVWNKEHEQEQTAEKLAGGTITRTYKNQKWQMRTGGKEIHGYNYCSTRSKPLFLMLIWRLVVGQVWPPGPRDWLDM